MDDLTQRLRELSRRGHWPLIGDEAADEIDRLNARIAALLDQQMADQRRALDFRDEAQRLRADHAAIVDAYEDKLERLRALVASDSWCISFQTIGQYRTALLKAIDTARKP